MATVSEPRIDYRAEKPYMGIRTQVPMKGMFKVVDKLRREMFVWLKQHRVFPAGPPFLRYHVIDMSGEMDIEVGVPTRCETYLTDPQIEPRKTKWEIEVAIKLADDQPS